MLQQTRVETVIPYFERFMNRFPTPLALAEAPEDEVLSHWSGLGYYRRARMLHAGAKHVATNTTNATNEPKMPGDRDALLALPGVGRYTAGAIASIAYGEAVGLVDGNVARVFARVFGIEADMRGSGAGMREAERVSEELVHAKDPGAWNQALMELGATICTPRSPACDRCPIAHTCSAHQTKRTTELPFLSDKKKPTPQRVQALCATTADGKMLFMRRKSGGLFGGLWEPPCMDGTKAKDLLDRFAPSLKSVTSKKAAVTHVLSHRKLTIDVHSAVLVDVTSLASRLGDTYEAAGTFAPRELDKLGIATLARKIVAAAAASV